MLIGNQLIGFGAAINKSLHSNSAVDLNGSNEYLSRTPAGAGNRKLFTFSAWVNRSGTGDQAIFAAGGTAERFEFTGSHALSLVWNGGGAVASTTATFSTTGVWTHIMWVLDTAQATPADRVKFYADGSLLTNAGGSTYPTSSQDAASFNNTSAHNIGRNAASGTLLLNALLAEINFVDGAALLPSDFGTNDTGTWLPKAYTGSFGTNGFYLKFSNSGAMGNDSSGNGNTWSLTNIDGTDQVSGPGIVE